MSGSILFHLRRLHHEEEFLYGLLRLGPQILDAVASTSAGGVPGSSNPNCAMHKTLFLAINFVHNLSNF